MARRVARAAAILCEDVRREMVGQSLTKEDRSPVTVADFGAQAIVCRDLARELPNDSVVGEEDSAVLRRPENAEALASVAQYVGRQIEGATPEDVCAWIDHGNGTVGQRFWTLDPIDGTKGFLRGDQYAVALALIEGGDLRVGVLACPYYPLDAAHAHGPRGLLFSAVRGEGAWVEPLADAAPGTNRGTQLRVVQDESSAFFRLVESVESRHGHHSLQETVAHAIGIRHEPMRMDSQAKYGAVARGDAALYLRLPSPRTPDYRENIWDHAAGALIVEEAGGRVTDVRGYALDFASAPRMERNRGVVVSNAKIHSRVLKELSKWLS
ncbi:MAG TPA: 3'(2'),5'-bisphosphate nucleotidase [bacterium]|nr:3'(2'),5'-bisphosphate nucleotidase [bacterium]